MYTEKIVLSDLESLFSREFSLGKSETKALFSQFSENIEVLKVGEEAVSMLFLLDAHYFGRNFSANLKYIFGAITKPEHRSKGYMNTLINRCINKARNDKYAGVYLVPASNQLRAYYKKLGFCDAFTLLKTVQDNGYELSFSDGYDFIRKSFVNAILPSKSFLEFQGQFDGGQLFLNSNYLYFKRHSMNQSETICLKSDNEFNIASQKAMAIVFDDAIDTDSFLLGVYE